ncbi:MAG TPA: class I SAM-dependent methyltransferase [Gammaproteobacteria bacterium]|nr:class I SAM-dependent methyltransferase [Gammaproteobacteria bacterium]
MNPLSGTYEHLKTDLQLEQRLPVTPDWSAAADFLFLIKKYCLSAMPNNIVECSSGLTTLILARCCQLTGRGHIFSLENAEEYVQQTQNNLKQFGLEKFADVILAPLEEIECNNETYQWYKTDQLPNINIDMLVIDGPPGFIQKHSRFPALPELFNQLSEESQVFLDDASRDEEKAIVNQWLALYPELTHEYIEAERGCSVLTVKK